MDRVLTTLTSYPEAADANESPKQRDSQIRAYIKSIGALPDSGRAAVLATPQRAFEVLDASKNSIGYLAVLDMILHASSGQSPADRHAVLDRVVEFLVRFDPIDMRYVGQSFKGLLDRVGSGDLLPPIVAVELLATAILRLDPSGTIFSSSHIALAKLAVEANVIEPALKVMDKDITSFPNMSGPKDPRPLCDPALSPSSYISTSTGLTDQVRNANVLEYNMLRALAYMSKRDWFKAHAALEQVITHPSKERGVSKIMLDAHKKWVLVGLLKNGNSPNLPSYTPSQARTSYGSLNSAYIEVATLFGTNNASQLLEEIQTNQNQKQWEDDGNLLLIREAMAAYQKWQIINLRNIYTEVPIAQVRRLTCSGETGEELKDNSEIVALIQNMIDTGMLAGKLELDDGAEGYLKFEDDSETLSEAAFAARIAQSHQRISSLSQQYKLANERLSGNKEYVKHLIREQKRAEKEGPDAGIGFDSQVEDEDLMTGIMSHG